jgi:hypothetical protein
MSLYIGYMWKIMIKWCIIIQQIWNENNYYYNGIFSGKIIKKIYEKINLILMKIDFIIKYIVNVHSIPFFSTFFSYIVSSSWKKNYP